MQRTEILIKDIIEMVQDLDTRLPVNVQNLTQLDLDGIHTDLKKFVTKLECVIWELPEINYPRF